MKIQKLLISLLGGIVFIAVSDSAFAIAAPVPVATWLDATFGTCAHFDYGDGQSPQISVENFVKDPPSCRVTSMDNGVSCYFDAYNCSANEGFFGEPHDQPAAAYCTGCGLRYEFSINEAKNCILYGRPG